MDKEIERKFLVSGDFKSKAIRKQRITQGYLSSVPERNVRIRVVDKTGYLTVKGKGNSSGMTRFEWEKEISLDDAKKLLELCEPGIIDKTRYIIPERDELFFEVDVFYGKNKGLIIAEIELPTEDYQVNKPDWLGKEITGDYRYYNAMLSKKPFSDW